ncbi:hypothetical protein ABZ638_21330 [Streptomyces sp. NPDC007107]|uniref:hypothetical protein n=1 Tax=Streptomyces sp. NPDC007107 TaxID=3156915 RepID=UPI0033E17551
MTLPRAVAGAPSLCEPGDEEQPAPALVAGGGQPGRGDAVPDGVGDQRRQPTLMPCSASIASIICRTCSHPPTGRPTIALTVASPRTRGTVKSGI